MLRIWSSSPKTALVQSTLFKMLIGYWVNVDEVKNIRQNWIQKKKRLLKIDKLLNVGNPEVNNSEKLEVK